MGLMNRFLFFQLMRFGIVGVTSASVHFGIVVMLVELAGLKPLLANIAAFLISFQVSYSGHRFWTFRGTTTQHKVALTRLLSLQIVGLAANEGLFYSLMTYFGLPYTVALFIVLTTLPIITFTVSKLWVFR